MSKQCFAVAVFCVLLWALAGCAGSGDGDAGLGDLSAAGPPTGAAPAGQPVNAPEDDPPPAGQSADTVPAARSGAGPAGQPTAASPAQQSTEAPVGRPTGLSGTLTVSFDFSRQSGHASNQFAVWIEDAGGNYVKTLYATGFTANGGYKIRPESIPVWVEKAGLPDMSGPGVDAITGATPGSGPLSYVWDLTAADGSPVPAGTYKFLVEGSLRWQNRVLYAGEIPLDGKDASAAAAAEFVYTGSPDRPALSAEAPENGLIGPVAAVYAP